MGQGKVETEAELDQRRPGEIAFGAIWLAFIAGDIALTTVTESAPSPLYWALLAYSAWGLVTVFGLLHLKAWAHWSFLIIVTLYFFHGLAPVVIVPQLIVIELCEHFQVVWPMFVLGPMAVLVFGLGWVHYVTGMKCKACDGHYGVSFSFISVLSIPERCMKCGMPADTA